jgi:WD40 repeat protein
MPTRYDVFLSHSSADKPAVEEIARRLQDAGIKPFLDKWHLIPGRIWQEELEKALKESQACAIFVGKEGLGPWAKQEMRVVLDRGAQEEDFPVIPVLLPGVPKPDELPSFLTQRTWVEFTGRIDDPGALHRLICGIRGEPPGPDGELSPIPGRSSVRSMVREPDGFIHRREYDQVIEALCAENPHGSAVGITTALRGAGGFGKTALAQAVCQDKRVQKRYPDGILLTTMGEEVSESGRLSRLRDLIRWWTESDPPVFERIETASAFLRELLANRRVLLVVDDVWSELDLIPFQGMSSALLITTREKEILPSGSKKIDVDAMEIPEAVDLLRVGLPEWDIARFNSLARRLGEWPLLLTLVNRQLRELVEEDGFTVGEALQEVESILESEGLTGFDRENAEARQWAVEKTLAVSLRRLSDSEMARYRDLAIFPEDMEIPVSVLESFWGNLRSETEKLCRRLDNLSLLLRFDRRKSVIQLHDVVRHYLVRREGENLPNLHRRLLDALRPESGFWKDLPATETYLWRYLGYHLVEAGERGVLRDLLLDFSFLRSKLQAAGVNALLADYEPFVKEDEELRLIQGALRLSAHVLSKDPNQLAPHLLGRLLGYEKPGIRHLLGQCDDRQDSIWLRPRFPTLIPSGGPLLRTLGGHAAEVTAVAVVDRRRVISVSNDRTLRVWDLETGQTLKTLEGHISGLSGIAVLDDHRAVSASQDKTLLVWDLRAGHILRTLQGHTARVRAVVAMDGRRAISAAADQTLRVWDLITGGTLKTLEGHTAGVTSVVVVDSRRAVSASDDGTLRVWDLETGQTLRILEGHKNWVRAVAVVDSRRVLSASADGTIREWDLESGRTLRSFEGHTAGLRAVAVVDSRRAVSASDDGTLRLWDLETGLPLKSLRGHTAGLTAVAVVDSHCVVSASVDGTIRVWNLETSETSEPQGHTAGIRAVAVVDDRRAVSASADGTIRIWSLETGQTLKSLEGHTAEVRAVAVVDDRCVVSASADETLRVWDLETGQTLKFLVGHTAGVRAVTMVDSRRAVSASADSTVRVWDVETGRTLKTIEHAHWVRAVAVVDSCRAVSANGTFQMWDLETGQILRTFEGHVAGVRAVTIVNGRHAVSASSDHMVRVWDLETGQALETLQGHTGWVWALAVLDRRRAVSASDDGTLRVWNLETGECLTVLNLDAEATAVAVAPDSKMVVAGDSSGRVHFLDLVESTGDQ